MPIILDSVDWQLISILCVFVSNPWAISNTTRGNLINATLIGSFGWSEIQIFISRILIGPGILRAGSLLMWITGSLCSLCSGLRQWTLERSLNSSPYASRMFYTI